MSQLDALFQNPMALAAMKALAASMESKEEAMIESVDSRRRQMVAAAVRRAHRRR